LFKATHEEKLASAQSRVCSHMLLLSFARRCGPIVPENYGIEDKEIEQWKIDIPAF
jgi:hypothetical protein